MLGFPEVLTCTKPVTDVTCVSVAVNINNDSESPFVLTKLLCLMSAATLSPMAPDAAMVFLMEQMAYFTWTRNVMYRERGFFYKGDMYFSTGFFGLVFSTGQECSTGFKRRAVAIINRPGVAVAVLHTPPSFINSLIN